MSMTVSRGMSTPSSWLTVVVCVAEYLRELSAGAKVKTGTPVAALMMLQRFFECVLEGVASWNGESRRTDIPFMAGLTNLQIAQGVCEGNKWSVSVDDVAARISKYSETLRKLTKDGLATANKGTVKEMILFLEEFREQGELDRVSRFHQQDEDDD